VLRFDESSLVQTLDRLPNEYRTAFAAACAQRLLPRYTAFYARLRDKNQEEEQVAEKYLSFLWRELSERRLDHERIEAMIKRLLATLPDEDTTSAANEPYCTDAGAAVVFSLQSHLTGQTKFPIMAARRVYHALDNFVINNLFPNEQRIMDPDEEIVLAHPLIQRELSRQQADLDMLSSAIQGTDDKTDALSELRKRAEEQSERVFLL
jgi:uncharacterized protein YjaG (DUF416 family)